MARPITRFLVVALLAFAAAACGTSVIQTPTGVTGQAKARVLAAAGKQGPMLLQVAGAPFREGRGETAAFAARILSDAYPEVPEGFTLDARKAAAPQYRFRLAFDPPAATSPDRVCSASESAPLRYDRRPARQILFMVFCRQDVAIAAVKALSKRMDTLQDPDFPDLLLQSARQMFAADPNDTGSLGILQFDPKPRLRINPLEGVF